jgi:hypothetical protein
VSSTMTIRAVRTGRDWGAKVDPVERRERVAGVPVILREFDAWDGPIAAGERGEYIRHTTLTPAEALDWWNWPRTTRVAV